MCSVNRAVQLANPLVCSVRHMLRILCQQGARVGLNKTAVIAMLAVLGTSR